MIGDARPLVSVVVPVFRHQRFLEPALRSILALDYHPLEIIIQDDASPDDAFDVIKRVADSYTGPHTVKVGRNEKNRSMGNFNVLMEKAEGDYIVAAHDDDIQLPDRVSRYVDAFLQHGVSMVTSNATRIDPDDNVIGVDCDEPGSRLVSAEYFTTAAWPQLAHGPTLSWHRDVFDIFGPIDVDGTARTSDFIIPYRASLLKGVYYLHAPSLLRRVHADSRGRIGRNTDDENVLAVEVASESITQCIYMLKTTEFARERNIIKEETSESLRNSIVERIIKRSAEIALNRNRLHMRKKRMTWIDHDMGSIAKSDLKEFVYYKKGTYFSELDLMYRTMPNNLRSMDQVVEAIEGPPWFRIALKNPLRFRYWQSVRRLQRSFR